MDLATPRRSKRKIEENSKINKILSPPKRIANTPINVLKTKIPVPLTPTSTSKPRITKLEELNVPCKNETIPSPECSKFQESNCCQICQNEECNCKITTAGKENESPSVNSNSLSTITTPSDNNVTSNNSKVNDDPVNEKIILSDNSLNVTETRGELQMEIKKVQRRRSTIGKGRRASCGGRRSLYSIMPLLSLEDQISCIPEHLPKTTKLAHILDIALRTSVSRMLENDPENSRIEELRSIIIEKSEDLSSAMAYKLEDITLTQESLASLTKASTVTDSIEGSSKNEEIKKLIETYQAGTKQYEAEYKQWKILMKERKQKYLLSKRDFEDAKSGSGIEEEEVVPLPLVYREFLENQPDYNQILQELKGVKEKSVVLLADIEHSSQVLKTFHIVCDAQTESYYNLLEKISFGPAKPNVADMLKSLISYEVEAI